MTQPILAQVYTSLLHFARPLQNLKFLNLSILFHCVAYSARDDDLLKTIKNVKRMLHFHLKRNDIACTRLGHNP